MDSRHNPSTIEARRIVLGGRVQGVGFRPFVYRLAHAHGVTGWVKNLSGQVEIFAQGDAGALGDFAHALIDAAPPLARPAILAMQAAPLADVGGFTILASEAAARPEIHVPPDYFACADCVRELHDPADRRYRYPFINCTQCGPRYTLITRLPYDRPNTTMAQFQLCPACRAEYENPLDRRFHAEPVACAACGPRLEWRDRTNGNGVEAEEALAACVEALRAGRIVAVKGIGGYHLMCDAASDAAVAELRARKPRPHKPLAVMLPARGADGLDAVRLVAILDAGHERLLRDPMRPIVLVPKRPGSTLSAHIAPGLDEIGVFLPYSPLHHLLLDAFGAPLVATSANVSGEPVLTDGGEVEARLAHVADGFLHHDRPIARPADDPVFRVIAGAARPLRLGRGVAPLEIELPFRLPQPLLAVGGHMKNTVALAWETRAVVSPHIGDLDAPRSLAVFEQVIADLQALYGVRAMRIVHDAHPGYASTRYARRAGLPASAVFHHHAHASALAGEFPQVERWLAFTWDGVGYGEQSATGPSVARGPRLGPISDGTLWGGEALLGSPGQWRRVASMRPFHLPGGERAGREPWRSALALCWEAGIEWGACPTDARLLRQAWERRLNAPQSSAVGRLFDAAAALTGLNSHSSFEGQGPMLLESAAAASLPRGPRFHPEIESAAAASLPRGPRFHPEIESARGADVEAIALPLAPDAHGVLRTDWAPLLKMLIEANLPVGERAALFHASLAQALLDQACRLREAHGEFTVGLSGGVFQNRLLTERAVELLRSHGFEVRLGEQIPCNDAGIAFGQLIESGWRR